MNNGRPVHCESLLCGDHAVGKGAEAENEVASTIKYVAGSLSGGIGDTEKYRHRLHCLPMYPDAGGMLTSIVWPLPHSCRPCPWAQILLIFLKFSASFSISSISEFISLI